MDDTSFTLKVRMQKAEVMQTLLYGCVTWTLVHEHFAELRTAYHKLQGCTPFEFCMAWPW